MIRTLLRGAAVCTLAAFTAIGYCEEAAPEETGPFATGNFSSTVWLTNQYMFRGISNSDGPAVQGSLDWTYNGFFAGAWGSNTEFSDSNFEIDYYGGYRWSWSGVDLALQGIYYAYPGEDENDFEGLDPFGGIEADYGEVNIGASHTFESQLSPTIGVNYYYSPDTFGEDGDSHTLQGSFGLTLPAEIGFYTNVGWNDTEGDKSSGFLGGYEYVYFSVGINKVLKGFKLDIGYHGTDESDSLEAFYAPAAPPAFPDSFRELIEGEFVFTVSRSF